MCAYHRRKIQESCGAVVRSDIPGTHKQGAEMMCKRDKVPIRRCADAVQAANVEASVTDVKQ